MSPLAAARHGRIATLGVLLALGACGVTAPPTATPTPAPRGPAAAAPSAAGATMTALPTALPVATAAAASIAAPVTASATPPATARSRATAGTATAAGAGPSAPPATPPTPSVSAAAAAPPIVAPAATPRGDAADDPCAPYAAGTVARTGRAVPAAPALLCIPTLALSAPIAPVGMTAAGTMAEPPDPRGVAWFAPGVVPGAIGNAAIAGLVDSPPTGPAIFWDLHTLIPGVRLVVVDVAGVARRFQVLETGVYRREEAPVARVFGPAPDANLCLITGAGTWDPAGNAYDSNLLVFARLQP